MSGYFLISLGLAIPFAVLFLQSLKRIAEGIETMADLEAQALADISDAIDAAVALIEKLAAAAANPPPVPVDHSAEIEALKQKLSDAVSKATVAPAA